MPRDQRRARQQVGQHLRQHLVAEQARQHDVKVGQQARAAADVGARHGLALLFQVGAQRGHLRFRDAAAQLAHDAGLDQLPGFEDLPRFFDAGLRDEGAARRLERDQAVARELVQRLPHHRARDREQLADLRLGELGARHQAALDDGLDDRGDDALGAARGRHDLEEGSALGHG